MSITLPLPEGIPTGDYLPRAAVLPCVYTSEVIPGLHYNIFQRTLVYGSGVYKIPPTPFNVLLYLDMCGGSVPMDDLLFDCGMDGVFPSAYRVTFSRISRILDKIGIDATASINRGIAFIDYFGEEF